MKIKKDGTTGNVLILDADDATQIILTPGQYAVRLAGGVVNITSAGFGMQITPSDVTSTDDGGGAQGFSGDADDLMDALSTIFNFAPA